MRIRHNFNANQPMRLTEAHIDKICDKLALFFSDEASALPAAEEDMCRLLGKEYKNIQTALAFGLTFRWVDEHGRALNSVLKPGAIRGSKFVFSGRPLAILSGRGAHAYRCESIYFHSDSASLTYW
jgi:hypothetical protein